MTTTRVFLPPIVTTPAVTLVGINDAVAATQFGPSVLVGMQNLNEGGEIISAVLISSFEGTGATQSVVGNIVLLNADPAVSAGDTDLTAAEWATVVAHIPVAATDWVAGTLGAAAVVPCAVPVPKGNNSLWATFKMDGSSAMNDVAGDDETLTLSLNLRLG